jgi:hypothetical protein
MVPVVPMPVQHAIVRQVPRPFAYVPTYLPRRWRYRAWDAGRETPELFPRGRGLNVWFSTPHPSGAGFHVYADRRCRLQSSMRTFHIDNAKVSWTTTFGDDRVWRCVRTRKRTIQMSVSYIGSPTSIADGARVAMRVARMLTSVRRIE